MDVSNLKRLSSAALLVLPYASAACWTPLHIDEGAADAATASTDSGVTDSTARDATTIDATADADGSAAQPDANSSDASFADSDAAPPAPQTDFYVDPGAPPPAFQTITGAAKAAAQSAASKRTIHVAPGTYSAASGETLPIELRGVSLVGAGSALTVLAGSGTASNVAPPTIAPNDNVTAAFIVGDPSRATSITGISIVGTVSGTPVPAIGTGAIICDRGNVTGSGPASANTTLDDVTVDGFDIGLRVTVSRFGAGSTGCSALVRASTFQNGAIGVFGEGSLNGDIPSQFVAIQLGDGSTDGGNVFRKLHIDDQNRGALLHNGGALITRSAVTGIVANGNHISNSDFGIELYDTAGGDSSAGAVIVGNDFGSLSNAGLILLSHSVVARLESNVFHDISTGDHPDPSWVGVGVSIDDFYTNTMPIVRRARGNTFFGNDLGLAIRVSTYASLTAANLSDFGTANDLGGNSFRCNGVGPRSYARVGGRPGGDVIVAVHSPTNVTIPLEGNTWDRTQPTISPPAAFVAGIDMGIDPATPTNVKVDTANAQAASPTACPGDIPLGP